MLWKEKHATAGINDVLQRCEGAPGRVPWPIDADCGVWCSWNGVRRGKGTQAVAAAHLCILSRAIMFYKRCVPQYSTQIRLPVTGSPTVIYVIYYSHYIYSYRTGTVPVLIYAYYNV